MFDLKKHREKEKVKNIAFAEKWHKNRKQKLAEIDEKDKPKNKYFT